MKRILMAVLVYNLGNGLRLYMDSEKNQNELKKTVGNLEINLTKRNHETSNIITNHFNNNQFEANDTTVGDLPAK